jgi:multiple sugar transport system substrate-binding protein
MGVFLTRRRLLRGALVLAALGPVAAACAPAAAPTPTPAPAKPAEAPKPAEPTPTPAAKPAQTPKPAAAPTPTPAPAAQPAAKKEVSGVVKWLVRANPAENKGQEEVFEPAIKKVAPNLKVERIIVPGREYIPKLNAMAAAGDPPELWGFGGNYIDYWARRLTEDLTPYIQADKWDVEKYFLPGLMDKFKIGGKYWGVSQLTTFGTFIIYNKKLFDQAGLKYPPADWNDPSWNFDTLYDYAKKLTKNPGKPDAVYGIVGFGGWRPHDLAYMWGTDAYLDEHYTNFIAPKTRYDQPELVEAHQLLQDWIWKEKIHPSQADIETLGAGGLPNPFMTGRIGMVQTSGWGIWTFSVVKDFTFGVAPQVPFRGKKNKKVTTYNDFWIIGRQSKNKDGAWVVIRAITSVDAVKAYAKISNTPPTVREAVDVWYQYISERHGQSIEDLRKVTEGSINPAFSQESVDHLFIQFPKINDTYRNEADVILLNKAPAAEAWPKITERVNEIVKSIYDQFKDSMPPK